jgi:multiple sugar transport system substrate-binding protein
MANLINNVPTTFDSLQSPDLKLPKQFQVFMDVYQNPKSQYRPSTAIGDADEQAMGKLMEKWQNGSITDIQAGLADAAKQVDTATQQVATP